MYIEMHLEDDVFCSETPSITTQDLSGSAIMSLAAIKKGMGGERDFIMVSLSPQAGCFREQKRKCAPSQ